MTCTVSQQKERGCHEPVEGANVLVIHGVEQRRCPRRPILENPAAFSELFWLYRNYKAGYLPEAGGLDDQPAKLMKSLRVIDAAVSETEKFKEEQESKQQRRRGKAGGIRGRPRR